MNLEELAEIYCHEFCKQRLGLLCPLDSSKRNCPTRFIKWLKTNKKEFLQEVALGTSYVSDDTEQIRGIIKSDKCFNCGNIEFSKPEL